MNRKIAKSVLIGITVFFGFITTANAEVAILQSDDFVGTTFWLISMGCLAATVFLLLESGNVAGSWKTPLRVAGLITGIAFVHYMYMRNIWVHTNDTPTAYRYIDWFITMPLQIIEFYLIFAAVRKVAGDVFRNLLIGSVVMVVGGYLGETGYISAFLGFVIWMAGWIYILYELFAGKVETLADRTNNTAVLTAFGTMRMIVTIGWAVYPIGYVFGYLTAAVDPNSLNSIYNLADFVNKIAFGIIIWIAAVSNTSSSRR